MDIFILTIVISLVLFVVIGNYAGKNVKNLDDYFVAGRRAPTILIVGTLVARRIGILTGLFGTYHDFAVFVRRRQT